MSLPKNNSHNEKLQAQMRELAEMADTLIADPNKVAEILLKYLMIRYEELEQGLEPEEPG